jgi:hypothetical protein
MKFARGITTVSSEHFGHNSAEKRLSAFISDLQIPGFPTSQLYEDDLRRVGFCLKNHKVGSLSFWVHAATVRDGDGDITEVIYSPAPGNSKATEGYTLVIYND